jgi:hypothetical protein
MTVLQLANELKLSGWDKPEKVLILAARYYKGLESVETLKFANLTFGDINHILYWR